MRRQDITNGMCLNSQYQEDKTPKTELEPADKTCHLAERKSGLEFSCLLHSHPAIMTKTSAQVFRLLFMHADVRKRILLHIFCHVSHFSSVNYCRKAYAG